MTQLHLYVDSQFASPYAMSVFVALTEKKLSFDLSTLDLEAGANHAKIYLDTSITGRVPTLIDDRFALSESSAITEYLEERYPDHPLYPKAIINRARARQIQAWLRSDLMPIRQERSTEVIFYQAKTTALSMAAQDAVAKLYHAADLLLKADTDYLFGEWSIADVDLAVMLHRLILGGEDVPEHLAAYARHQWQRPSVQLWVNKTRPPL